MNKKERENYNNKLAEHWQSDYYDYLSDYGTAELRRDVKERAKYYGHCEVPNTNKKATWYTDEKGAKVLRSYYTDVCKLYRGRVYKLWQGYSATTARHIDKFMDMNGYRGISKHDWIMCDLGKSIKAEKIIYTPIDWESWGE